MALDIDKFTNYLSTHAASQSTRQCAKRIREALQHGGAVIAGVQPRHAKDWGATLLRMGFRELAVETPEMYSFAKGDIVVIQPYEGGNPSGHIAAFNGKTWFSDFTQRDFWSGPGYRLNRPAHAFYRP